MMQPRPLDEAGSSSIHLLLLLTLVCCAGLVTAAAGQALAVRHRAATAADLAALAAGDRVLAGPSAACARGREIAYANDASMVACTVTGEIVDVLVEVRLTNALRGFPPVRARARAGPTAAAP
jgi:secretion/DNA translocation related TadE-like protein